MSSELDHQDATSEQLVEPKSEQHEDAKQLEHSEPKSSKTAASPAPSRDSFPKRERKSVEHFKVDDFSSKKSELEIRVGAGTKLGEIPNVVTRLSWLTRSEPMLKTLHRVLYHGHAPSIATVKQNIGEFSGFVSDEEAATATKKLEGLENSVLSEILSVLDLEVSGTKVEMVERLSNFLKKPHATGRGEPTKGGKRKSTGGKKSKKGSKKSKKEGTKRGTTSFMEFANENRAEVVKKNPTAPFTEIGKLLGAMWRELDEKTKAKYSQIAAEKNGKSASAAAASDDDDEDDGDDDAESGGDSDDDEPLVDVKTQLRNAIRKILKSNDVSTLSVNKIREILQSEHNFSAEVVTEKKAEIKEIVTSELEKMSEIVSE